jgi:hypothetical protein
MMTITEQCDWIEGDIWEIPMPCHPEALREGGTKFLNAAFHHTGALSADNEISRIVRFEECPRGSTGRKILLSVEYLRPDPSLHTELFVKFSRAFDDPHRDRQRYEMELEARFAAVSQQCRLPIDVATSYFADFHHATGTGVMITQCIPYGTGNIERHYEKCLDWQMPDQLEHYRALVATNARLAGAHRAGKLPSNIDKNFPFDPAKAEAADPIRYDAQKLRNRISRYAEFCTRFPQLLPENIREPAFHARLMDEMPRFLEHEHTIKRWLYSQPEMIVFCHWNANADNAWFWRDDAGALHCGLIDWGRVGQMNAASALWGSLSGAETFIWDDCLGELLGLFIDEFHGAGGPLLDSSALQLNMEMLIALLGICWLLDTVPIILREIPGLETARDRFDPRLLASELARTQLHMLTIFMNMWATRDLGRSLDALLERIESRTGIPEFSA